MATPGLSSERFNDGSNPVISASNFNASADKHQGVISGTDNKFQRQILGTDEFTPAELRNDLTRATASLSYSRMASTEAWKEIGAEMASRRNNEFVNLAKA